MFRTLAAMVFTSALATCGPSPLSSHEPAASSAPPALIGRVELEPCPVEEVLELFEMPSLTLSANPEIDACLVTMDGSPAGERASCPPGWLCSWLPVGGGPGVVTCGPWPGAETVVVSAFDARFLLAYEPTDPIRADPETWADGLGHGPRIHHDLTPGCESISAAEPG